MTAVLSPPQSGGLLQRRMSHAQYPQPYDMNGFMSTYNMSWKQPMVTAEHLQRQDQQHMDSNMGRFLPDMSTVNFFHNTAMAPNGMNMASNTLALDTSVNNNYNFHTGFNSSLNTMPILDQTTTWPANMGYVPTAAPVSHARNDNLSAFPSSPIIKSEEQSPIHPVHMFYDTSARPSQMDRSSPFDSDDSSPINFSTDIDTLMKAIQGKSSSQDPQQSGLRDSPSPMKSRKRYQCSVDNCKKSFYQKTHLEIHTRAHTGVKPFICKEPTCGQRFSQLGNLKTHERRHTGERPYKCDLCGKTFAQRGNVRAHKIVHTSAKPFTCKLDSCNKQFTQLGNLKSHQNKFHSETICNLKRRFETMKEGDVVSSWEKDMWEYFGSLYKNCNKGIRGRGKDRRISNTGLGLVKDEDDNSRRNSYASVGSASSYYSEPASAMDYQGHHNPMGSSFSSINSAIF